MTPISSHDTVDVNLNLNSINFSTRNQTVPVDVNLTLNSTNFPTRNQADPMSGQPRFQRHGNDLDFNRRSHPNFLDHVNDISSSHLVPPQNTLNINVVVGNYSSININLLNNNNNNNNHNISPQYTRNDAHASFRASRTQYSSPIINIGRVDSLNSVISSHHNQETFAIVPCLGQNEAESSSLRRYFPYQNNDNHSNFQGSAVNHIAEQFSDFQGNSHHAGEDELNTQLLLQTPESMHMTEQANIHVLPQEPSQDENVTEQHMSLAHANNRRPKAQLRLQAQRHRGTMIRSRNQPYKYGPYTCDKCEDTFLNANSYAAHVQKHYKDESPSERKKRREAKFRSKDLHISQTSAGITIMPGAIPVNKTNKNTNKGECSSSVKIKEEIKTEPF